MQKLRTLFRPSAIPYHVTQTIRVAMHMQSLIRNQTFHSPEPRTKQGK